MKPITVIFRYAALLAAAIAAVTFTSCKMVGEDASTAGGKPYELIVSVDQQSWDGEVGDTLKSIFQEPVAMINQIEPMYDVMRVVPTGLKGMIIQHRNILIVRITDEVQKPVSVAQYDAYAKPQIMVTVAAPDSRSMVEYLTENRAELQKVFENAERDRAVAGAKRFGEGAIEGEILQTFGLRLNIPKGYKMRNKAGDDFIWISNEHPLASQGVVIYSYPYEDKSDFLPENLTKRRDEFVSRIPGPSDGSYMITSEILEPEMRYMSIYGRSWAEMRGFWDVKNDFMGGPFISYSTLDTNTNRVVTVDFYLYSPKENKRNMLRALEHIIYSAEFPGSSNTAPAQ